MAWIKENSHNPPATHSVVMNHGRVNIKDGMVCLYVVEQGTTVPNRQI